MLKVPARVAIGVSSRFIRSSRHHDLITLVAPFGSEVDDPVGATDHIEVVLNHHKAAQWA